MPAFALERTPILKQLEEILSGFQQRTYSDRPHADDPSYCESVRSVRLQWVILTQVRSAFDFRDRISIVLYSIMALSRHDI